MFEKLSQEFEDIKRDIDSILQDAKTGEVKKPSRFDSPILMNSNDFMSSSNTSESIDIYSISVEDTERRDNLYAYYQAVFDAFDGTYMGNKSYIKNGD